LDTGEAQRRELSNSATIRKVVAIMALPRVATAQDIANLTVFLSSDTLARHIMSQTIVTAGGMEGSQRGARAASFHRFDELYLGSIDDLEPALLVVEHNGLPVRADHEEIDVRHSEGLPVGQDNSDRLERLGTQQLLDLISDHQTRV
jgi:hypothetical protein